MNDLTLSAAIESIGWMLLHSTWQFAIIAALAFCADRLLINRSSSHRYFVLLSALAVMTAAPIFTWSLLSGTPTSYSKVQTTPPVPVVSSANMPAFDAEATDATAPINELTTATPNPELASAGTSADSVKESFPQISFAQRARETFRPWLSTIVAVWLAGVSLFATRPVLGWVNVRRLKQTGTSFPGESVQRMLEQIAARLNVTRRVDVLASSLISSPIVVGCFRSVILLPAALLSNVSHEQLEALLAHELAHVKRYDYVVNLFQTLLETVFFYHPAVWWLSIRIRNERENCCDDLVVSTLNNRADYGRALLAVAEFRADAINNTALAVGANGGSLVNRISRLIGRDSAKPVHPGHALLPIAAILLLTVSCLSLALSGNSESQQLMATLPDGTTIELLGIATGETDSGWWSCSGSLLDEAPFSGLRSDCSFDDPERCRSVAVRITGQGLRAIRYQLAVEGAHQWHAVSRRMDDAIEKSMTTNPLPVSDFGTVRVGIGEGEWGPAQRVDRQGRKLPTEIPEGLRPWYDTIRCFGIEESEGAVELNVGAFDFSRRRHSVDWKAVSRDGEAVDADRRTADGKQIVSFPLRLNDVDYFEYRLLPYRTWVTFSNVAFQPNETRRSDVTPGPLVTIGPLPPPSSDRYIATLPGGQTVELIGLTHTDSHDKWWKADGRPREPLPDFQNQGTVHASDAECRALIYTTGVENYLCVSTNGTSFRRDMRDEETDEPFVSSQTTVRAASPGSETGTIEVWLATTPLSHVRRLDAHGKRVDQNENDPMSEDIVVESVSHPRLVKSYRNGVLSLSVKQKAENAKRLQQTQITYRDPFSEDRRIDLNIKLVDLDGKKHLAQGAAGGEDTGAFIFDVPSARVAGFEYQFRPYYRRVVFENVALRPEQGTQVKTTVKSLPHPNPSKLRSIDKPTEKSKTFAPAEIP